ncbi:MAG: single-stranded-DNA-specific exonuclease RecJ [Candidatus Margulisiibacteriota bacterium]
MHNLSTSIWRLPSHDPVLVSQLSTQLRIDPVIIHILLNRGLRELVDIQDFLQPRLEQIRSDFCPRELPKAIARVVRAIDKREKVVVFGDYDADGVTGTVLLYDALMQLGIDVSYYVPLRYTEGYGLNLAVIKKFRADQVDLIITVDCGISNVEEIALACSYGIDVIVTDHHTPPAILPKAVAIINPKCEHQDFTANLAGVGVAYKLVYHLMLACKNVDILATKKYLELVAIGTITDVVSLIGDNRIFVKKGIEKLNKESSLGLFYLLEQVRNGPITTTTIGFGIGPRINAAGRLDSASLGIELLMTRDRDKAKHLAEELNSLNERRKREGERIFEEAVALVENKLDMLDRKVLVLSSESWEPGVIGIVTSQMAKRYERPVVLITTKGNISRGSIRSVSGINIFSTLEQCQEILLSYGGHKEAAGFEIDINRIEEFRHTYTELLDRSLENENLCSVLCVDYEMSISEVTFSLFQNLKQIEPFGEGNREPIFLIRHLNAIDYKLVGKDRSHLKILFVQGADQVEAIGYKMAHFIELLNENTSFDVLFNLTENVYNGQEKLVLKVLDIKPSQSTQQMSSLVPDTHVGA